MSLGSPAALGAGVSASGTTVVSSSFTASADAIVIAVLGSRQNTTPPAAHAISDGAGLTWTPIFDVANDFAANPDLRMQAWWAQAPVSPAAITVTGTGTSSQRSIAFFEYSGAAAGFSNVTAVAFSTTGDPAMSGLVVPAAGSHVVSVCIRAGINAIPVPANFTQLVEAGPGSISLVCDVSYDGTSPGTSASYSS
jgi:hypothetical protein